MITMMLLCSMITPTKIWNLCEIICRYHCLCNHIHICKRCFVKCKICFTFAKDVSSNPSTVLHAVYLAHNCTSTMQQQTATQLVSGSSAKQGTHALVLPCHSQPHTMGQGSLAPLWKQRPSMHVCMLEQSMLCWWYWVQRLGVMGGKPFSGFTDRALITVLGLRIHQHSPAFQTCQILGIGDKADWHFDMLTAQKWNCDARNEDFC